nr:immunoglobulin heavy chain junction region [Macaca mulatta]MOW99970.1 immunoglobulin heavy chain junction region [Macaca mulatta]MOX00599.1 immunoglobulin heavy chain junction region [Macaca mulatta]MOX00738.1 immunoglobulin heavy chain junction region [Macaca mulatta]MOX00865.1 immunoglobulin heavy chain junction region [Macaca mulatta]
CARDRDYYDDVYYTWGFDYW